MVTVTVTDPGDDSVFDTLDDRSSNQKFTLNIVNTINAWHNFKNPYDVNDDGFVSAVDVLQVINYLNANGNVKLPVRSEKVPPFVDVNKDDSISPIDVLMVINRLKSQSVEGESAQNSSRTGGSNGDEIGSATPLVQVGNRDSSVSVPASETTRRLLATSQQTESGSVSQSPSTQLVSDLSGPPVEAAAPSTLSNSMKTKKPSKSRYEDQVDIAMSELYSSIT